MSSYNFIVKKRNDTIELEMVSLQGPKGDPFTFDDFTPEQLAKLKGPKGEPGKDGNIDISTWTQDQINSFKEGLEITEPDLTPYAKKTDLDNYQPKGSYAKSSHTHSIASIANLQTTLDSKQPKGDYVVTSVLDTYATKEDVKNVDVSSKLAGKADKVHTHTIANITGLQTAIDGKQAKGDYALKSDIPSVDLSGKADVNHGHAIGDVTGLQSALDGKASTSHTHSEYASKNHSHSAYVEKVDGKVLSTNDFTNAHKTKVDNIPDGFEYKESIDESFVYNAISIENAFSKEADLYKYLNARTGLEFTSSIQTLDDLVNSETAMVAIASSEVGMKDIAASKIAMDSIAANETAMNAVINSSTAMNAVINSSTAMNAVANSSTAMNAVANSSTAMNAVINSSTAMNAVANSSTAMNAVINSSTAMNAVINSSTAMNAVANSTKAKTYYTNSTIAGEFLILEFNTNNYFKYISFKDGKQLENSFYKELAPLGAFLKAYPKIVTNVKVDEDSDDYIKVFIIE